MKKAQNIINISSFNIASILLYDGIELVNLLKANNSSKVYFQFKHNDNIEPLINAFWNHELEVEPIRFLQVQKYLKSRLHSEV